MLEKWNRDDVAKRYISIIDGTNGDVPLLSPNRFNYVKGSGAPVEVISEFYSAYLRTYGAKALLLGNRKDLIESIKDLAKGSDKMPPGLADR